MFSICALAYCSVPHSQLSESKLCLSADYSRFWNDYGGVDMSSEFPFDPQIDLSVQGFLLLWPRHWEEMRSQLPMHLLYERGTWGPTMAANMAKTWFSLPEWGHSFRLGTAEREDVLINVAAIMSFGPTAGGSEAGLLAFFNYLFSGPDKRLGFASPAELMQAAVPYMGDLVERDIYAVAYRADQFVPHQDEKFPAILFRALMALEVWPVFFEGLTIKKPLFG